MIARLFLALVLCLQLAFVPSSAQAQSEALEGSWDFRLDGVTIFRFEISRSGAQEWRGTWSRPESFGTDGYTFTRLRGGVEEVPSMTGIKFNEKVELSFDDPRPNAIPDIFRFELIDYSSARMTYVGTDLAPFAMVRAAPGDPIGKWNDRVAYSRPRPGLAEEAEGPRLILPPARTADSSAVVVATQADTVVEPALPPPPTKPDAAPPVDLQDSTTNGRRRVGADFLDGL